MATTMEQPAFDDLFGCMIWESYANPLILQFFAREGCTMVEMSCQEHDAQAASSQFITHTVGRMLGEMGVSRMRDPLCERI